MQHLRRARARLASFRPFGQIADPYVPVSDTAIAPGTLRVVCAWCGKHIEDVSAQGAEGGLSHGICPECYERMMGKRPRGVEGALRRALLTLQAKPFIADPQGRFPGLIFSLTHQGGQPDAYQSSVIDQTSLRPIGHVYASQSISGYYEVQSADVESDFQGMGIGQSLYLILAEAVPTGLMPNISASVSTDAENVWRSLPQYGMVVEFDLDPQDIQSIGPQSWKSMENRGLNVVLLDPEPPPGYASWREMIESTGGTWKA